MKRLLTLFIAILCGVAGASAQDLTVASFNVRYQNDEDNREGNGWERRCPYVCGLIDFESFDIFGAQEVLHPQLLDMCARLTDYDFVGVGRDDGKTRGEYAPIFYKKERFERLDSGHFWLSERSDRPTVGWDAALPRICTWGRFLDRRTGRRFWFFNLHMDHIGKKAREKSAELVVEKIRSFCAPDESVILTGDFNVDQHDTIYTTFTDSGVLADSYETAAKRFAPNGTFNDFHVDRLTDSRIDHVFVSPSFRVVRYGVLTDTYRTPTAESEELVRSGNFPEEVGLRSYRARAISDHFPVVVKLGFAR